MHRKTLVDIRHKFLIKYKHIQVMHNELRYQAKTHAISEKLSKEKIKFCIFSPNYIYIYFLFYFFMKNNKNGKNILQH